jgi:membrane metallo-endopeptidase-like protein 1
MKQLKNFDNFVIMSNKVEKFSFYFSGEIENWWEPSSEKIFKENAQCIIDLYGNFTDSQVGLKLNGIANQGENIADIGGLKEAYKGYCKY